MQPIAADDVASSLVDCVLASPHNGILDLAGPEQMGIDEAVCRLLESRSGPRPIVTDPSAGYFGAMIDESAMIPLREARIGETRLGDWLSATK